MNKKHSSGFLNHIGFIMTACLLTFPCYNHAWVSVSVSLNQDITGSQIGGDCAGSINSGNATPNCHKVILNPGSELEVAVDRCDTDRDFFLPPYSNTCPRWNLIWQYGGSAETKSWPIFETLEPQRLPTYKELTKLVLSDNVQASIIEYWVSVSGGDVWFISSSYARGTGTCGNHIYGVNASTGLTGRFKLIDVEVDDGAGGTTTETQWRMLEGTMLDSCNYLVGEPNVHALIVNKSTVKELM